MLIENKPIPESWTNKPSYSKIITNILKNEDMKTIAVTNLKNNMLKEEYNKKLKENFPKIINKYKANSPYEFDNDLMTLIKNKKNNDKSSKRFQSINEEYKEMIKKQNIIIEPYRPDSIKDNIKNILEYRKKIALKFKYNNYKIKREKKKLLPKSRSQIINSIQNSKYNTLSTSDNNSSKGINNINSYNYRSRNKQLNNNLTYKEKVRKEFEDKFMITGMNNKQFKESIIEEEETFKNNENNKNDEIKRKNNIKKSQSVFY